MKRIMGRITWKAVNPEAVSAFITLHDAMSMPLAEISVSVLYTVDLDDVVDDPGSYLRKLFEETGIFYNPNRDRYDILKDFSELDRVASRSDFRVRWALVWEGDGSEPGLVSKLQERYGFSAVRQIAKANLWRLELIAGDESQADEFCRSIIETKSRTKGLLANPHDQSWLLV